LRPSVCSHNRDPALDTSGTEMPTTVSVRTTSYKPAKLRNLGKGRAKNATRREPRGKERQIFGDLKRRLIKKRHNAKSGPSGVSK